MNVQDEYILTKLKKLVDKYDNTINNFNPYHDKYGRFCSANFINLSKEDYLRPKKDYILPNIPTNILNLLNKSNKPLILKKNIIEKNKIHHPEVDIEDYNEILSNAIYKTDIILQNKPNKKPNYYTCISQDKNSNNISVIEIAEDKNNHEIINFFKVNDKRVNEYIKKTRNEGGEILITDRLKSKGAARLSALESSLNDIITHH